ncbi:uracil phosphoribosyltransferase [Oligoflexus tunisiensis]|uniref:uracil phosphoribosyltransferase n=1 Tax=Oligoflexus tunisiensis TaxID=708132 RepID=UPI000A9324E4|nr:uracil phosphoribosyltransferase [Oligoflexus tunisiensis]
MSQVLVVDHPMVQDRLTAIRRVSTDSGAFRQHMSAVAAMLFYEAARILPVSKETIETPLQPMQAPVLKTGLVLVSVLRAGLGFLDGILPSLPTARVGYLGLARNPKTLAAESYYANLPKIIPEDQVFVLDPMLATGHTVIQALKQVEAAGARHIHLVTLLASPEGVANVQKEFPAVRIVTASIDTALNHKGYIVPGLGDAGDRLYGTLGH